MPDPLHSFPDPTINKLQASYRGYLPMPFKRSTIVFKRLFAWALSEYIPNAQKAAQSRTESRIGANAGLNSTNKA